MEKTKTIINVKPTFIRKADALKYIGVGVTLFNEMADEFKIKTYLRGTNVVWYKVSDLDMMIEKCAIAV